MTEIFDCADAGARATGIASAVSAVKGGRLVVLPFGPLFHLGHGIEAQDEEGYQD